MSQVDWSKAPEWANARIASRDGLYFAWAEKYEPNAGFVRDDFNQIDYRMRMNLDRNCYDLISVRPSERDWNGQGLPPVGTVCEYTSSVGEKWYSCEIIAYHGEHVWLRTVDAKRDHVKIASCFTFRPIKTQAQIEAEAREDAVQEMRGCLEIDEAYTIQKIMEVLYDAGYRLTKQEGE